MRLRFTIQVACAMAILAATPWIANAQPIQGFYVSGGPEIHIPMATRVSPYGPGLGGSFDLGQKAEVSGQLSAGYAIGNGWRFELEGTLSDNDIKGSSGTPVPAVATGSVRNSGVMANALFDMDIGSPYVFPYAGLGVGYQSTRLRGFTFGAPGAPPAFTASGESGSFAVQAMAGLSFPVPYVPGLSVTAGYRIMDITAGDRFALQTAGSPPPGPPPAAGSFKFHNQFTQDALIGLRFAFDTPTPPVVLARAQSAEAPAPAPRSFAVPFDGKDAKLSNRATAIVKEAAGESTKPGITRIEVAGTGDAALSARRAKAIADGLAAAGATKDGIDIVTNGAAAPAFPGVPETRNRRVEIVIP